MTSCGNRENNTGAPLVDGAPFACSQCRRALCLRQQVMNLALGNTEEMLCLFCLEKDSGRKPVDIIADLSTYVLSRACFEKQWVRYANSDFCPDRQGCFPDVCFARTKSPAE